MAKPVNFGTIYGLGPRSLRAKARADDGKDMTERQAKAFLGEDHAQYPGVRAWHGLKRNSSGAVRTLGGRRVAVSSDQFYGAKAKHVMQGTGGARLKRALILHCEGRAECPRAVMVLAVYDEVVLEVPETNAADATSWLAAGMTDAMAPLITPVPVEVETTVRKTCGG